MKLESEVQSLIMIEAAKHGIILWRNNSGALKDATGRVVRYGLGNNSEKQNKVIKSSDLIGIWPQEEPVPSLVSYKTDWILKGIFIAIECKKEGWVYNPKDEREQAQKAYIDFVISKGGAAGFCSSVDDFLRLIGKL